MALPVTTELVKLGIIKQDMERALQNVSTELEIKSLQSHVGCPVLIERAWIGMKLMENLPHTAYLLKPEPFVMAFNELATAMDDPFDAFHPPNTLSHDTYDPTKPCYLFTIPRELRDMIYDDVISSGNLKILQTSKQLHDEGIGFLYKRRTCHLNIDITKYVPMFSLQEPIAALIQNVNIEIFLKHDVFTHNWQHNIEPISTFSGSTVMRQTCQVVLLFAYCDYFLTPDRVRVLMRRMDHLRALTGFSRVTLEVRFQGPMTAREQQVWPDSLLAIFSCARDELRLEFGPSIWNDTNDRSCGFLESIRAKAWKRTQGLCRQWNGSAT